MDALTKQTNFEGGISTGGPGLHAMPNLTPIGFRMNASNLSQSIRLTGKARIQSYTIIPDGNTAGTVNVGDTTTANKYVAAVSCAAAAYQTNTATQETAAAATVLNFTATGLDGDVLVMLNVLPLEQRS